MNFGSFLQKALPFIGAAAEGNVPALASLAFGLISDKTGKKVGSAEEAAAAVAGATPDQLIGLQESEMAFKAKLAQMNIQSVEDMVKLGNDDRANARARQVALKDRIPAILSIGITIGFFGMLVCMLKFAPPTANKDLLNIMLGALGSAWASVVAYYFGSSAAHDALTSKGDAQ